MRNFIMGSKKINNKFLTIMIISLVLSVSGTAIFLGIWFRPINIIEINNDKDFKYKYHFPGKGTEDDPYIIDGYTLSGNKYHNIKIYNVTKYFIIQNCLIENSNQGIVLYLVADGVAKIVNNTFRNNELAIDANSCGDCFINGNNFENNNVSISVAWCNGYVIQGNTFIDNTKHIIDFHWSYNIKVVNNIVKNSSYRGIIIYDCQLVLITGNNFSDCSFRCISAQYITSTIIANNSITNCNSGIETVYGESVAIIDNNLTTHYYGISFNVIKNGLLEGNYCANNTIYGIESRNPVSSTIRRNVLQNNNGTGMFITLSGTTEITNNTYYNNTLGLEIIDSNVLTIRHNIFEHNLDYGLHITAVNATIWQNNFIENNYKNNTAIHSQAKDLVNSTYYKGYSLWYDNATMQGNYWSELVWYAGVEYLIDPGNRIDYYPLEEQVVILH